MKREWTVREAAEVLKISEPALIRRAEKEGWTPVTGDAGGTVYPAEMMPDHARRELASACASMDAPAVCGEAARAGAECALRLTEQQAEEAEADRLAKEAALAEFNALPEAKRRAAEARMDVVLARRAFVAALGMPKRKATELFCLEFRAGRIRLAPETLDCFTTGGRLQLSRASVDRWDAALSKKGLPALADGYTGTAGTALTEAHQAFIKELVFGHVHISHAMIHELLSARFPDAPGPSAVRRWTNRFREENKNLLEFHADPDAWKSRHQFAVGDASADVVEPNQLWEMDSTPADVMLIDGRHMLIGCVDVFTRRGRLLVAPTSSAMAVSGLLRRCVIDWGVPQAVKTDNGKDYVSKHMVRVLEGLGVAQWLCDPFAGDQKPHVERFFKTFSHGVAELLPGFIGHNVAERKAIEARRSFAQRIMRSGADPVDVSLTAEAFQQLCDRWLNAVYHPGKHRSLGVSPDEAARRWTGTIRRITDERALDMLMAPAASNDGLRTIGKKGIVVDGASYAAMEMVGHEGEQVRVLLDPTDLGAVHVYLADGGYLCTAVDPDRKGIDRNAFAADLKKEQLRLKKKLLKERTADLKREAIANVAEEYLESKEANAARVIALPRKSEAYTTPALEEAALAAAPPATAPTGAVITPEEARRAEELIEKTAPTRLFDTPHERYVDIRRRQGRGEANDYEIGWADAYEEATAEGLPAPVFRVVGKSPGGRS